MTTDMTKGSPLKTIVWFFLPLLAGNIIQQIYEVTDTIFVSIFVGANALAGVGISSVLNFTIFGFILGVCNGFCIVLAQRFGGKRKKGIKLSVAASIHLYIVFTIFITIISILVTGPLIELMKTPQEVSYHAKIYSLIRFIGTFAVVSYNLFSTMLKSVGNNKTPFLFLILSAALNIIFDYITVGPLKMGTAGAAISTILAQLISSILCLILIYKKYKFMWPTKKEWLPNKRYILKELWIGLPLGLEFIVTGIGIIILQEAINKFGIDIITGFEIAMRIENIIIASFIALTVAIITYTAQNFGARKYDRIKKGTHCNIFLSLLICFIFSTIIILLLDKIINIFLLKNDTVTTEIAKIAIKKAAKEYIYIAIFNYPALVFLMTYRGIVRATGDSLIPLLAGFCELIMRVIGAFILAKYFGHIGAFWGQFLAWYGALFIVIVRYIKNIKKLLNPNKIKSKTT